MSDKSAAKKRAKQRRKDLSAWDRFWLWVKVNEKVAWVILLLLIAPAFAFTGATQQWLSGLGNRVERFKIGNETVYHDEVEEVNRIIGLGASFGVPSLFGEGRFGPEEFLLCEREAERLGIYVSDEELGRTLRAFYWRLKVVKEASEQTGTDAAVNAFFRQRIEELSEKNAWNTAEWSQLVRENGGLRQNGFGHPRVLEEALRRYMRASKVIIYVSESVQVTEAEVREEFQRKEQFRKLSFIKVEPDEAALATAGEGVTDDEVERYFNDNSTRFRTFSPKLSTEALVIPYEHFGADLEFTEEEVQAEYESLRGLRFRRGLEADVEDTGFQLLTPEQEKELEAKMFKPLAEVHDEVIKELTEKRKKELARTFANEIKAKVYPGTEGAGVTLAEVAAENDFVTLVAPKMVTRWEAEKELGEAYSSHIESLFSTLDRNSREADPTKHAPVRLSENPFETKNGDGLVLYANLKVREAGMPSFEDAKDEAREALVKERALDVLRTSVDATVKAINDSEKSLDAAASELDAKVHTTAFLKRTDVIYLPVEASESEDEEPADTAAEPEAKTEYFPGSRLVLAEGFLLESSGAASLVRDDLNGALYVVRFDDKLDPDPAEYDSKQASLRQSILATRRNAYINEWRKGLWERYQVGVFDAS